MLKIAVCDDEAIIVDEMKEIIYDYGKIKSIDMKIFSYYDGLDLLNSGEKFDIIFLDIEMKSLNGIETAKKIREYDMLVPIVYVTSYTDYWRRAYKVHAFDFVKKPIEKDELHTVLDDYLATAHDLSDETITLITSGGAACFKLNEVYCFMFESKKNVIVHLASENISVKENLLDIYERLDKTQFYQSRRDCVVNLKYVQKIQNDFVIVMKNGDLLPLAQKKRVEFMTKLSKEFIKDLKGHKK